MQSRGHRQSPIISLTNNVIAFSYLPFVSIVGIICSFDLSSPPNWAEIGWFANCRDVRMGARTERCARAVHVEIAKIGAK